MNFEKELKKRKLNIRSFSTQCGVPYATLYPIIKGQVDIRTCTYSTVEKIASSLGYLPHEIVYQYTDFQTFRNDLHHKIQTNDLKTALGIIERNEPEYYELHEDYIKALYLVATVDYISRKYEIPLCDKYSELRKMKLKEPYYVGDSEYLHTEEEKTIKEFRDFNIFEGDLYDAV